MVPALTAGGGAATERRGLRGGILSVWIMATLSLRSISGKIQNVRRMRFAINLDNRPLLPRRNGQNRHFLCGGLRLIRAEDNVAVRCVNNQFEGHVGL